MDFLHASARRPPCPPGRPQAQYPLRGRHAPKAAAMHPSSHTIDVRHLSSSRTLFPCFQPRPQSREGELACLLARTVAWRRAQLQLQIEIPAASLLRSVS
jgi:hypothetical protein